MSETELTLKQLALQKMSDEVFGMMYTNKFKVLV